MRTEFNFFSDDGLRVACYRWEGRGPASAVMQIAHGMGEHARRYLPLIEALVSAGFTVYANDHRGHGHTATSAEHLGDFGAGGFDLLVADMVRLHDIAAAEHPGRPMFLLGHSMGSFAAQQYVIDYSDTIDGLVLSGSGDLAGLAKLVSSAPPGTNILNAAFEPSRTSFDWLSRDTGIVDAFIRDPLCFAQLQPESFLSFLGAAFRICSPASLGRIQRDLPVYVFSGTEDPVGQQLAGVRVLIERYRNAGLTRISHDFYPGGRHEMLNEINRTQVVVNLLGWLSTQLERTSATPG